jgi:hypothetical protein
MITVEVLDAGPDADDPHTRFTCVAKSDDGKATSGTIRVRPWKTPWRKFSF